MKKLLTVSLIAALISQVTAQDVVPIEKAREIARLITSKAGKLANPPFEIDLDLDQPQFLGKDSHGGIVIPAKGLTREQIANAGKDTVPVAMVWFRNLMPANGPIVAPDKEGARVAEISDGKKIATVHPFFAGVRKNDSGRLELVLFGKSNREPFVSARLLSMPSRQEVPIELAAYGGDDTGAILVMSFVGKYQAEIKIVPHETPDEQIAGSAGPAKHSVSKASEAAHLLGEHLNKFKAKHVRINGDMNQASLFEKNDIAALIIPDKALTADKLNSAGKKEIPVGQLWLKNVAPDVDGRSAADSDLKYVEIRGDNKTVELPQFLLTAKRAGKQLTLVIYSAEQEPLMALPLESLETRQSLPIELEGAPRDDSSGQLSLYLLGKFHAKMVVRPH